MLMGFTTVRHVMHDLADGPAAGPVRRVELRVGAAADKRAEFGGRPLDDVDEGGARGAIERRLQPLEAADGVTKRVEIGHV